MSEEDVRAKIASIDEKRTRAKTLNSMAEWPMFAPSTVKADKRRGILHWFGSISDGPSMTVDLTRDERSELRDWLYAKATRLTAEADAISESLNAKKDDQ